MPGWHLQILYQSYTIAFFFLLHIREYVKQHGTINRKTKMYVFEFTRFNLIVLNVTYG